MVLFLLIKSCRLKVSPIYISHCRQWNQRYWANFDNYAGEGLAFLFIGGEGEASPGWLNYGMWYEYYYSLLLLLLLLV